jgi:hypothetical protein
VLVSAKEKKQRREIGSGGMSDRRDTDVSTRNVLYGTKMGGKSGNRPDTYFFKCP